MDDSWGSPWASESSNPLPSAITATKRPVTPEKTLPSQHANSSPWRDDDGFGDWAAVPATEESDPNHSSPLSFGTTDWEAETAAVDIRDDAVRTTWITPETEHSDLPTQTIPSTVCDSTEATQDPWAGAVSLLPKERQLVIKDPSSRNTLNSDMTPTTPHSITELVENTPTENGIDVSKASKPKSEGSTGHEPQHLEIKDNQISTVENAKPADSEARTSLSHVKDTTQNDSPLSRPSSAPSDHSQHDEVIESPRTSFEDEPKRPKLEIEGSSKVKQLVQLFDGLAVVGSESEPANSDQDTENARSTDGAEEDLGDFGEFEDGTSDTVSNISATEEISSKAVASADLENLAYFPTSTLPENLSVTTKPESQVPDIRQVKFNVDSSLIDGIFTENVGDATNASSDTNSLGIDTVQETFSSIEERKVWYRISRYGTMRKYSTGDEDYVRINWYNSEVHEETVKIVSKWMEEDRIGGGVVLGGANRLGSLFGWGDKNGAPLTLESAFADRKSKRRSSKSRSRKSSVHSRTPDLEHTGLVEKPLRRSSLSPIVKKKNSVEVVGALSSLQFNWSTSRPTSAVSEAMSPVLPASESKTKYPQPLQSGILGSVEVPPQGMLPISRQTDFASHQNGHSLPTTVKAPASEAPRAMQIALPTISNVNDEDDDWGEMVSSPAFDDSPFEPLKQTSHQSSKSTMNDLNPIRSPNGSIGGDHKSSMSITDAALSSGTTVDAFGDPGLNPFPKNAVTSATKLVDAWASADFSVFEAPPSSSTPPSLTTKAHVLQNSGTQQQQAPRQIGTPSVRPALQQMSPRVVEREEEKTVKRIVQNLPDLSYMLRR